MKEPLRLNVIAIGGKHQFLHIIPLALEFARGESIEPTVFLSTDAEADYVRSLAEQLDAPLPRIEIMRLPGWARLLPQKLARLWVYRTVLRSADALLSAERTSIFLTRLPGHCPPFFHIPHGAGDRQQGFERRLALFDYIFTAGEKDRRRIVDEGLQPGSNVQAIGGVKIAAVSALPAPSRLFENDRPIVLYNPHFSRELGSFPEVAERIVTQFRNDEDFNLVVAPHVRLRASMSNREIERWESFTSGNILVDMGSDRSIDMTYTRAASIYLGDVSSQVYEFISTPRPCIFIDHRSTDWSRDPNYRMWHFGEVLSPDSDFPQASKCAFTRFPEFEPVQREASRAALGGLSEGEPPSLAQIARRAENAIVQQLSISR